MKFKRSKNILLSLAESENFVECKISYNGNDLLHFVNDEPKNVIVKGWAQNSISERDLFDFAKRESYSFSNGEIGVLSKFLHDKEVEIFNNIIHIRKLVRKIVKSTESANTARDVIVKLKKG